MRTVGQGHTKNPLKTVYMGTVCMRRSDEQRRQSGWYWSAVMGLF